MFRRAASLLFAFVLLLSPVSDAVWARGFGGVHLGGGGGFHPGGAGPILGGGGEAGFHLGGGGPILPQGGAGVTRGSLSNFLGLPADNGLHNLSGDTQSKGSQIYDNLRAGNGPFQNFIPGETQSRGSQIYDQLRAGDHPFQNFIPGETQSKGSQIYDNLRAGNGPFQNFIPGQTQKPGSRLYDSIRAGNHPLQPYRPWIAHNNAVVIRRNFNNYYIFTPAWYRRYPAAWYPAAWAYGDAWAFATWASLSRWFAYGGVQPMYYDYGNSIVYQYNSVTVNNQNVGTAAQYYQQAQTLASDGDEASNDAQWLPLGVFAISDGSQTSADMILELAVDKQGVIRGNYTNTANGQTEVVKGGVDKQTQRAAWTVGDNDTTVMETGLYNLTKDEAPVLIHYGADRTEQRLLVRLNQKDQDNAIGDASSAASK